MPSIKSTLPWLSRMAGNPVKEMITAKSNVFWGISEIALYAALSARTAAVVENEMLNGISGGLDFSRHIDLNHVCTALLMRHFDIVASKS